MFVIGHQNLSQSNFTHCYYLAPFDPPSPFTVKHVITRSFQFVHAHKLLLILLLLHVSAVSYQTKFQHITFDEPHYMEYAKRWLQGNPGRSQGLDDSKSPIIAVCWLPRMVAEITGTATTHADFGQHDQQTGRYMMILFSLFTAVYLYLWCKQLWGGNTWIAVLSLLLFDPLYLAYATIITTDLASGGMLLAVLFHFWQHLISGSRRQCWIAAIFTGLAIITKQSLLFIIPLLPLLGLIFTLHANQPLRWSTIASRALVFLLLVLLVINLAFYFSGSFTPFGKYRFNSDVFIRLQHSLPWLRQLPVPLPYSWVQSLDMLQFQSQVGGGTASSNYPGVYLLGEYKNKGGFWYYYLVMVWYKMPPGSLILILAGSFVLMLKMKADAARARFQFLIIALLYYLVILSCFNPFQTGIRHLLIVYPILFMLAGFLVHRLIVYRWGVAMVASCVFINLMCTLQYYPDLIPYTNPWIGNKALVYRKIGDSSIDYGQADDFVANYLKRHPEYSQPPDTPKAGKYIVWMGQLLHYNLRDKNTYPWLQHFKPDSMARQVVLLYQIDRADLRRAGLHPVYKP